MRAVEDSSDDGGPHLPGLEELWLYWSEPPGRPTGRELRRALFASFASALQWRWSHGGYNFRFVEETRTPDAAIADDTAGTQAMLRALFPGVRGTLDMAWGDPVAALDDFLDRWLFFRRHRPYVCQDDVPGWMIPALREPWAACVRELVGAEARAAVFEGEHIADNWGDHGVVLVIASGTRLCMLQVGLWTD